MLQVFRRPQAKARVAAMRAEKAAFEKSFSYEDDKRAAEAAAPAKASEEAAARHQQPQDDAKRDKRR